MIVFPALDRVSESVLPSDVQHPADVAAQRIQFRFAGRPRRQVVEVADLSGQRRSRAANLSNERAERREMVLDRKSTRLNSSHGSISYAVFCLKKKREDTQ